MLNLMKKDLKLWLTGKRIWMFLLGVLIIGIISTSWHGEKNDTKEENFVSIGVVDFDDSQYSRLMLSYFQESDIFTEFATVVTGDLQTIQEMFEAGELSMYLVVPENFAQNLIDIQNVPMQAYINTEDTTRAILLKNMLTAYEKYISAVEINCVSLYEVMKLAGMSYELRQQVNFEISMDLVFTALGKTDFFEFIEIEEVKEVPLGVYYAFEVVFLFLSYLAMLAGMDVLREKRQGMLSRLMTTGTRISTILVQKLVFYALFLAILLGLFCVVAMQSEITFNASMLWFLMLYFIIASAFFMLLSAFFTKLPTFLLISNVWILFGAVLGGGLIPILYLPPSMKDLAKTMVNFWFLSNVTLYFGGEQKLTVHSIAVLIGLVILLLFLASSLIGRKEGMHREDI